MTIGGLRAIGPVPLLTLSLGAALGVAALGAGSRVQPLLTTPGTGPLALPLLIGLVACGLLVRQVSSGRDRVWGGVLGAGLTLSQTVGAAYLPPADGLGSLATSADVLAWTLVRLLGLTFLWAVALTALFAAARHATERRDAPFTEPPPERPVRTWRLVAVVLAVLVLCRIPVLAVWWPGVVPFDTFRSLAYSRFGSWELYEPLGHSAIIWALDSTRAALGWSDTTMIAVGAVLQILLSSLAWAFMLVRMAHWQVPRVLWWAALAWVVLVPANLLYPITLVKDGPFTWALVAFLTCLVELLLRHRNAEPSATTSRWARSWPCVGAVVLAALLVALRSNGVHVVLLGALGLLLVRPRPWRLAASLGAAAVAMTLVIAVPATQLLDAKPGPSAETYSVPIQQLARVAAVEKDALPAAQQKAVESVFGPGGYDEVAAGYDPAISDPVKSLANEHWQDAGLGTLLRAWLDVVPQHPGIALDATLAGTVGYWSPGAPSEDGLTLQSSNDVRDVVLDIDPRATPGSVRAWIVDTGVLQGSLLTLPVVGALNAPGTVIWGWIVLGALVLRSRGRHLLPVLGVMTALLLTILAGPVSGGMRYAFPFFAALPLAVATAWVAVAGRAASDVRADEAATRPASGRGRRTRRGRTRRT